MKVLFCSSEVVPFASTGGLGSVCGSLPLALEKQGIEVAVILPLYRCIDKKKFALKNVKKDIWTAKIGNNIPVYFIEHDEYFDREGLYGNSEGGYPDNLDRFLFYSRRTLEFIRQIKFKADIVHCHDWHASLIPVFLKFLYRDEPFYKDIKSVLTIHNMAYQGLFPKWDFLNLGLSEDLYNIDGFEFYDDINLLKAGIIFSDAVTTVSPTYAQEIQTPQFGCGLDGVLTKRQNPVAGILNGIDETVWDPQHDSLIVKNYSEKNIEAKLVNKRKMQENFNLMAREDVPVFGFVGRLSSQKGLDLIAESIEEIMDLDLQVIVLGAGDSNYQEILEDISQAYPEKFSAKFKFDESVAHEIYAGADVYLMPSTFEPCGLGQMISLRYGTIPLVYKTGGLADTIVSFDAPDGRGNGFVFNSYSKEAFVETVTLALQTYQNKKIFSELVKKALGYHFSWDQSAKEYQKLYTQCLRLA